MPKQLPDVAFITCWYAVTCCGVAFFLYGFFPMKGIVDSAVIDPPSYIEDMKVNAMDLYKARVDRLIVMVIDALRVDFVSEEFMPFLMSSLRAGQGCLLKLRAEPPTVTMPRIKAITTGSVPQFVDIVLNFASTQVTEDSLLRRARECNKVMAFYGDDTWLKLFPGMFTRSEGVSSFYVSDYTEVDDNVTRRLSDELQRRDWHILILHYLGLDHIGHTFGPSSPLAGAKLREMDDVVKRLSSALDNRTALLVTGDHGMRDAGGHGGASTAETQVPLAWLGGSPCSPGDESLVAQTDVAPTLAALLGLPLPADSVGRVLPQLLGVTDVDAALYVCYYNALRLVANAPHRYAAYFQPCFQAHRQYLVDSKNGNAVLKLYHGKLLAVSQDIIRNASSQSTAFLYISAGVLVCGCLPLMFPARAGFSARTLGCLAACLSAEKLLHGDGAATSVVAVTLSVCNLLLSWPEARACAQELARSSLTRRFLMGGTAAAALSLASTSFVEEEHQTWYYLLGSLALVLAYQRPGARVPWLTLFVLLRMLRALNQVGDKWSALPDVSDWLQQPDNRLWLDIVFICGVTLAWMCCWARTKGGVPTAAMTLAVAVSVGQGWPRVCWILTAAGAAAALCVRLEPPRWWPAVWTAVTAPLLRPWNVLLLPSCHGGASLLHSVSEDDTCRTLAHVWLARALFFCQGQCNSLASVDVAAGYVGQTSYSPARAGLLVLLHVYAMPVLTFTLLLVSSAQSRRPRMLRTLSVYLACNVTYVCMVALANRHHLFVWSVFSPKLLVEAAHAAVLCLFLVACTVFKSLSLYYRDFIK